MIQAFTGLTVAAAALARVRAAVAADEGRVRYALRFGRDEAGRATVAGTIGGSVRLICQRCLQPMAYALQSEFLLGVVASDDLARQLPDHLEPLVVVDVVDLAEIIEDEVLLCLPIVGYHAAQECGVSVGYEATDPSTKNAEAARPNPFEALAALKNK